MGLSINTNIAATRSSMYLATNHANLQKSLDRLSSGKRITEPADDAGGLAVSMKLEHTGKVLRATSNNISNGISLLQVQDGILKSAGDIVSRMGELKSMSQDVTKNATDIANYDSEFSDLQDQLYQLSQTEFNGIDLFDKDGQSEFKDTASGSAVLNADSLAVVTDENGTTTNISQSSLLSALSLQFTITGGVPSAHTSNDITWDNTANLNNSVDHSTTDGDGTGFSALADNDYTFSVAVNTGTGTKLQLGDLDNQSFTHLLQNIAELRAANGGQVRRMQYTQANIENQITNLSSANGRIMDVDIAQESSNLAKQQILVQASASMTAQANVANDVALMLLR